MKSPFFSTLGLNSDLQGLMYLSPQRGLVLSLSLQRGLDLGLDEWDDRIIWVSTVVARLLVQQVGRGVYPISLPPGIVVKGVVGCVHLQVLIQCWQ